MGLALNISSHKMAVRPYFESTVEHVIENDAQTSESWMPTCGANGALLSAQCDHPSDFEHEKIWRCCRIGLGTEHKLSGLSRKWQEVYV